MSASSTTPKAEALLQRLEWTVLRRLDGLLHGDYRTLFRGFGIDLVDLREYQADDDVRHIDWNVTARMQTPYVREYQEDRELCAWFLLDLSPSLDFGSGPRSKRALAIEFVSVLARLLSRHGNRVGVLFYGGGPDALVPARSGRRHVLHLMQRMLAQPAPVQAALTDLTAFLGAAYQVIARRSLVFVISDFVSTPGWGRPLGQLARRHETLAVRLFDALESELPDLGLLTLQDAESGEQIVVDTHDKAFRRRFNAAAQTREAALRGTFVQAGIDALELRTDDDLLDALLRFEDLRRQRSRLAAGASLPGHLGAAG